MSNHRVPEYVACLTGDCGHISQSQCDAWLEGFKSGMEPENYGAPMTVFEAKNYLDRNFNHWRVYETVGCMHIKVKGPISTNQIYQLHEEKTMGMVINFTTVPFFWFWFCKNKVWKTSFYMPKGRNI